MERVQCTQVNFEMLFNATTQLLHSMGHSEALKDTQTFVGLLNLMELETAKIQQFAAVQHTKPSHGTEKLSSPESRALECKLETPTHRYIFAGQQNLDVCLANGGGVTSLVKYANVVYNKGTKRFMKHREVGHFTANQILEQAGY